jgi:oligopeptide transport system ATP-binding protein
MENILETSDLTVHFPVEKGLLTTIRSRTSHAPERVVHAVCEVSLSVKKGETFGLVGESGSGKSTLGRSILRLIEPTSGKIEFEGVDITHLSSKKMVPLRKEMQMVFQDPYSSLDPRMRVWKIIGHPMERYGITRGAQTKARVIELLEIVGLNPEHADRYPHQFSGGQKQRIAIASTLALNPKFIIADEAVSALDVSIQAQILNLFKVLKTEYELTYLFIAHNLDVVQQVSDRIGVMYLGRLVELGGTDELLGRPLHPYTKALLSAIPIPDPRSVRERIILKGELPSPIDPPSGCRFRTRCPYAQAVCAAEEPELRDFGNGRWAACHFAGEV